MIEFTGDVTTGSMRAQVADSWHRSAAAGVSADSAGAPITLDPDVLRDHREAHQLAPVFPLLDDVLGQAALDCDAVMAVCDASAQLLWVCGRPDVLRRAEQIGFVEGANWDERVAGTNAPGMAITLGRPVSVVGSEHFRHAVRAWSCAASPIHDPLTGELLGVLDITGGDQMGTPQTLAMVRAAARMAESELARIRLHSFAPARQPARGVGVALEAMGRQQVLVRITGTNGKTTTLMLSPRHSEIALLLASAPLGLSGDELGVLLYETESQSSTLRVELNRMRNLLGDDLLGSRPYRLLAEVSTDWHAVEAHLAAGALTHALRGFRGPLLPRSTAPGVVRMREQLDASLRAAVLRSGSADLMSTWTRSAWGADDYEMWVAQRDAVAPSSPLLSMINGQLARLDRELA